jgi:hypothetical protein
MLQLNKPRLWVYNAGRTLTETGHTPTRRAERRVVFVYVQFRSQCKCYSNARTDSKGYSAAVDSMMEKVKRCRLLADQHKEEYDLKALEGMEQFQE